MIGVVVPSTDDKEVQEGANENEDSSNDKGQKTPRELSGVVDRVVLVVLAGGIDTDDAGYHKRNSCMKQSKLRHHTFIVFIFFR